MGDVAGIGPEVIARAWGDVRLHDWCRPVVVGHPRVMERAVRLVGGGVGVVEVARIDAAAPGTLAIPCWNPSPVAADQVPPGADDARAGRAAYDYLVAAAQAALAGQVDAITTAPLSKAALHRAGLAYPGHTEILAEQCGVAEFAMMLYLPPGAAVRSAHGLGVVHVTLHTSIRSIPALLTTAGIAGKIRLIDQFMRRIAGRPPRIGVCALNPHAGEQGLFGDEELRVIAPAVREAQTLGLDAAGPFPADTLLKRACSGEFDAVVAMYHDQGHIALKLIGFDRAVNITLGLPIVRTSPSHGTAFDIAWRGAADSTGLLEAVRVASLLAGGSCDRRPAAQSSSKAPLP